MENDPRDQVGRWIRSCHPATYKSGQWGLIVAIVPARDRDCFLISWPDRMTDLWAVTDPDAAYEFADQPPATVD